MDPDEYEVPDEDEEWDYFDPFPMIVYAVKTTKKGRGITRLRKWQYHISTRR